ncbi:hypothetical protein B0H11DRAFT_2034095 [Mycena galericulata]|nr:hypothetical protein B0H11DRAFT_2034095 [Mycena galericulata]
MSKDPFPWNVFSANTLRPMMGDILRSGGYLASLKINKEDSIALLQKIERLGLEAALKEPPVSSEPSISTSKRKHEESNDADPESSAPAPKKRGRKSRQETSGGDDAPVASATRSSARKSDAGHGLLTRRQAAQARGDNIPATRSWKPAARSPRKASQKASGGSASAPLPTSKPKSKGQVFDGVELVKRPDSQVGKGKGKGREAETEADGAEEGGGDEDAEGELIDDTIEVDTSSLENSNKENDHPTFFEIANADTDVDADGEDIAPPEDIGSPPPQITVEPTDDQIEEARNHEVTLEVGSPAPEITIEPMADEGGMEQIQENEHGANGGLLRPRIGMSPSSRLVSCDTVLKSSTRYARGERRAQPRVQH